MKKLFLTFVFHDVGAGYVLRGNVSLKNSTCSAYVKPPLGNAKGEDNINVTITFKKQRSKNKKGGGSFKWDISDDILFSLWAPYFVVNVM